MEAILVIITIQKTLLKFNSLQVYLNIDIQYDYLLQENIPYQAKHIWKHI